MRSAKYYLARRIVYRFSAMFFVVAMIVNLLLLLQMGPVVTKVIGAILFAASFALFRLTQMRADEAKRMRERVLFNARSQEIIDELNSMRRARED